MQFENNMLRYHPDPPPPPECDVCGDKPYKTHDNKLLCYHCWVQAVSSTVTRIESLKYAQQNLSDFCRYLESDIKDSGAGWDDFIYNAWQNKCAQDYCYSDILTEYINDCDRSDLAEQLEKWRQ